MKLTHWLFTVTGAGVMANGTLLGTVGGPIKTWDDIWQTTYGHIWATAFIVATFTLLWGITFGYKQSMKVFSEEERWIWKMAANGDKHPDRKSTRLNSSHVAISYAVFCLQNKIPLS